MIYIKPARFIRHALRITEHGMIGLRRRERRTHRLSVKAAASTRSGYRGRRMNMTQLEHATQEYWNVSSALRLPGAKVLTCEDALTGCRAGPQLAPERWRLKEHFHVLAFDIIEGNTKWRKSNVVGGDSSTSILPMRNLESMRGKETPNS